VGGFGREPQAESLIYQKINAVTNPVEPEPSSFRIAVAIPCFNEAAAIASVIEHYQSVLPEAEVVVFNNNSTDGTGEIARAMGVRVFDIVEQGKGHVVRAAFRILGDFDVVVLTDGDGTYPAESVSLLVGPLQADAADMAVGARRPVPGSGAMSPVRGIGNLLIRIAFRMLIGRGTTDLLSGYRTFNRRFREAVQLRSSGFEIEAELATEAVARRLRVVEIAIPYYTRISGTESKLRAFRDGRRILVMILFQSLRLRPIRPVLAWLVPCALLTVCMNRGFAAVGGFGLLVLWGLYLLDLRTRH
jgi:glycosyltransferase involved in cell wall biosynthesis